MDISYLQEFIVLTETQNYLEAQVASVRHGFAGHESQKQQNR